MPEFVSFIVLLLIVGAMLWLLAWMGKEPKEINYTPIVLVLFFHASCGKAFRYNSRWWKKQNEKTGVQLENGVEMDIQWDTPVGVRLSDLPDTFEKYILSHDEIP